jgi:hypothetical protein
LVSSQVFVQAIFFKLEGSAEDKQIHVHVFWDFVRLKRLMFAVVSLLAGMQDLFVASFSVLKYGHCIPSLKL